MKKYKVKIKGQILDSNYPKTLKGLILLPNILENPHMTIIPEKYIRPILNFHTVMNMIAWIELTIACTIITYNNLWHRYKYLNYSINKLHQLTCIILFNFESVFI